MATVTLSLVKKTVSGFHAEGTTDLAGTDVRSLRLYYKAVSNGSGHVNGTSQGLHGCVRVESTGHGLVTDDFVLVKDVRGTIEANGDWRVRRVTADEFDLKGSVFMHPYTSGGAWAVEGKQGGEVQVAGANPPSKWSIDVTVEIGLKYEVHATLSCVGAPSIVQSESLTVDLRTSSAQ